MVEIDHNKKIDILESRISNMIDLIENFKHKFIYNDNTIKKEFEEIEKSKDKKLHKKKLSFSGSSTRLTNDTNYTSQTIVQPKQITFNMNKKYNIKPFLSKTPKKSNSTRKNRVEKLKKLFEYSVKVNNKTKGYNINRLLTNKHSMNNFFLSRVMSDIFSPKVGKEKTKEIQLTRKKGSMEITNNLNKEFKLKQIKIKNFKKLFIKPNESISYRCKSDRENKK